MEFQKKTHVSLAKHSPVQSHSPSSPTATLARQASIATDDEGEIVCGDVATVTVKLFRKHLAKEEALGPDPRTLIRDPESGGSDSGGGDWSGIGGHSL